MTTPTPSAEVVALEREIAVRDAFLARVSASLGALVARVEQGSASIDELRGFARELAVIAGDEEARAPRRARIDLLRVVESSVARWRERTRGQVDLRLETANDVDLSGEWDPDHVGSIMGELLSNACKYGAGHPVTVRVEGDARAARLIVEDSGRGIEEDVFGSSAEARRFRRGTDTETTALPGFGVGVWLVHALARAHGGGLELARRAEGGTRAVVELPR
ncbi:MAG: ATP-binding protein [Deltaproteobacteria bacterium]|nr:ATP-binding protein [Deltaproteobacteria bacterium]